MIGLDGAWTDTIALFAAVTEACAVDTTACAFEIAAALC
jgi:hypothetical protein